MAEAKKVPVADYTVQLLLTREEAEVTMALVGNVVSDGPNRYAASRVYYSLLKAGVASTHQTGRRLDTVVQFQEDEG